MWRKGRDASRFAGGASRLGKTRFARQIIIPAEARMAEFYNGGGGCAASVDSFARVRHLVLPRNANSETVGRTQQVVSIMF